MDEISYNNIEELYNLGVSLSKINQLLVEAREEHAHIEIELFNALSKIAGSEKLSQDNKIIVLIRNGGEETAKKFTESSNNIHKLAQAYRHAENMVNLKKHLNNSLPRS